MCRRSQWPEWRNGRRTGLKNPLLAILGHHISSLATGVKPLILLMLHHTSADFPFVPKGRGFLMKLAQILARPEKSSAALSPCHQGSNGIAQRVCQRLVARKTRFVMTNVIETLANFWVVCDRIASGSRGGRVRLVCCRLGGAGNKCFRLLNRP